MEISSWFSHLRGNTKRQKKKIGKVVLKKKNKVEGFMLPNINASYKATLIKTVWPWGKGRQIYQWAWRESRNRPSQIGTLHLWHRRHCRGLTNGHSSINSCIPWSSHGKKKKKKKQFWPLFCLPKKNQFYKVFRSKCKSLREKLLINWKGMMDLNVKMQKYITSRGNHWKISVSPWV